MALTSMALLLHACCDARPLTRLPFISTLKSPSRWGSPVARRVEPTGGAAEAASARGTAIA
jgi:hypothetical protein